MAETHAHEHHHHQIDPKLFMRTFVWLTFLMAATIGASFINWGTNAPWVSYLANAIALTIACWKATLVVLNFMGVKHATRLTQVYAIIGFLWVTLMGITLCDYFTRHFEPSPGWEAVKPSPDTHRTNPQMANPWAPKGGH
jgi:caa(3)-type oxidase subunit IV